MSPKSKASDRRLYPKPWDPFSLVLDRLRGELERHLGLQPATTKAAGTVLDFGCGDKPYAPLALKAGFQNYVGADIAENGAADVHVREDGTVPLPDGSVDAILSTQVLEHVSDPQLYLSECYRLLRSGGSLFLSIHGVWLYHPIPTDFWRWTVPGLQRIVTKAGFRINEQRGILGIIATIGQMTELAFLIALRRLARVPFGRLPVMILQSLAAIFFRALIATLDTLSRESELKNNACVVIVSATKP